GAQLKHIKQLVEYITGMDTRIGYPNEHLSSNSDQELSSPLYATVVGLLMKGLSDNERKPTEEEEITEEKDINSIEESKQFPKKTVFEKWGEKLRDFLDNAE
ncbi:MAG: cell division protein FtsA, partial [Flavobacteriaceae bacterium]|nr:cell division protein FtsA [Flavobacteriaceae bacterium]